MTQIQQAVRNIQDLLQPGRRAHLVGIGGVGMSALAKVLNHMGLTVSGSDMKAGRAAHELPASGIQVFNGHDNHNVSNCDFIIYSSAIRVDNPERRQALISGIPSFHRAEVLSNVMNRGISIGVTGTHGKTTTSAFISFLLNAAGLKPTCLVGGSILNFGSNTLLGDPNLFVAEVDESDKSHLNFRPDFAVLTNLEEDHMDVYQDFGQLKAAFSQFVENIQHTGHVIFSAHDSNLKEITHITTRKTDYGLSRNYGFGAEEIALDGFQSRFRLYEKGEFISTVSLTVPGTHNVLNALAAIAAIRTFGIPFRSFESALPKFRGAGRRLEVKLEHRGWTVIDDYAHHPTEVIASLKAIRTLGKPTTVVFQPHRYSRMQHMGESFSKAFHHADRLILTDIYSANEENTKGVNIHDLCEMVKNAGHPNVCVVAKEQIVEHLLQDSASFGVVAFLGAGDIGEVACEFADRLRNTHPE